ncbi:MAG: gluconate 2-dehydrogenase subunit 3 family protein [Deltaproteobacteria bacterium]|nr:gluconate 2-dehydrogenase subunit 3 family protein [Deltaproteobacteria bacterium]
MIARRSFLIKGSLGIIAILSPFLVRHFSRQERSKAKTDPLVSIPAKLWLVLSAVQEHLFPSDGNTPGAQEIKALSYLGSVLEDPLIDSKEKLLIRDGAQQLEEEVQKRYGLSFVALSSEDRENVLRRWEQNPVGGQWIATILSYIFEALLSDPVYGGNPEGVGWTWLEFQAGFPRPPSSRHYLPLSQASKELHTYDRNI